MLVRSGFVAFASIFIASAANAADRTVSSAGEIRDAFQTATAGDTITISPGTYSFSSSMWTSNDGQPGQPITVRADSVGSVKLEIASVEGIVINNAYWVIENLWIAAACGNPDDCQAGIGVKPPARGFLMLHSRTTDWYQHIKGSREPNFEVEDVSIVGNELYNTRQRHSLVIDIVGGKRWRIIGNYVHDYGGSDNGDFGIFLKGVTSDGVIEQNLVLCYKDLPPSGASVGISLGQGGTGSQYCPNNDCSCEDRNSIVRNNIVAHCTDTGLHARRACGGKFFNNTVYDTAAGLQLQEDSPEDPVEIRNNLMSRRVYGGTNYVESNNLFEAPDSVFRTIYGDPDQENFGDGSDTSPARDRGAVINDVTSDYCGTLRTGTFDFGAIEFPAACVTWPWTADRVPVGPLPDAGMMMGQPDATTPPGPDSGMNNPTPDAGVIDPGHADASVNNGGDAGSSMMPMQNDRDPTGTSGGCGCSTSRESSGISWIGLMLLAIADLRRRRRQREEFLRGYRTGEERALR